MNVVCLCAAWCGACREYLPVFTTVAEAQPEWRTHWVDVEDFEAELDEADITTFPMILIANNEGTLCFAGPVTPQPGALQRLCEAAAKGSLRLSDAETTTWLPLWKAIKHRNEKTLNQPDH
ncbi:MAG: thioredoxin family protein [Hydrogenophaga sp.]|jgi:thiol-disulfide isomerase/thioredoxin|nr:thioredoxin family protein [Hydrogenophaga sp.]